MLSFVKKENKKVLVATLPPKLVTGDNVNEKEDFSIFQKKLSDTEIYIEKELAKLDLEINEIVYLNNKMKNDLKNINILLPRERILEEQLHENKDTLKKLEEYKRYLQFFKEVGAIRANPPPNWYAGTLEEEIFAYYKENTIFTELLNIQIKRNIELDLLGIKGIKKDRPLHIFIADIPDKVAESYKRVKYISNIVGYKTWWNYGVVRAIVVSPNQKCFSSAYPSVDPILFIYHERYGFWRIVCWDLKNDLKYQK